MSRSSPIKQTGTGTSQKEKISREGLAVMNTEDMCRVLVGNDTVGSREVSS